MSKKTTRKAMLVSIVALTLCFAMLIGTTYAWFTDSVTSANNIIKSGTLNIDLLLKTKDDTDYVSVKNDPAKKAFDYQLWEPGYTEWVNAKVSTTGSLALKYTMKIIANGTVSALANVIDVYYAPSEVVKPANRSLSGLTKIGTLKDAIDGIITINDTLIPGTNAEDFATLALHMQESAGNEYQDLSIGTDFSLQILATQYTYESDSFDEQYDAAAPLPFTVVTNASQLNSAFSEGGDVVVDQSVAQAPAYEVTESTTINGNGNTISVDGTGANRVINVNENNNDVVLTLNDVVVDGSNITEGYSRGVSMYGNTGKVTLNSNGSTISSPYYAVNIAGGNVGGVEVNLNNSSFAGGWDAINVWSPSVITVNSSVLSGYNNKTYNADGWNDFATIVFDKNDTASSSGSVLNVTNSTIKAEMTTGNSQWFVSFKATGVSATFTNCTFEMTGTPTNGHGYDFVITDNTTLIFNNCKFIKNGVEVDPADLVIAAFTNTAINTSTIEFN